MLLYGVATGVEFVGNPELLGVELTTYRIYYISAGTLVGLLGAGQVYLVAPKRVALSYLAFTLALVALLASFGSTATLADPDAFDEAFTGDYGNAFRAAAKAFPATARVPSIILNSVGGTVLIAGALWSFVHDRTRFHALLIATGGTLPYFAGSLGVLNMELEFTGILCLLAGYMLGVRWSRARGRQSTDTKVE